MSLVAEGTVPIFRSKEDLWDVVMSVGNLRMLSPGTFDVDTRDHLDKLHLGSSLEGRVSFMGAQISWRSTVTDVDPPRSMTRLTEFSPEGSARALHGTCVTTLTPSSEGTVLGVRYEFEDGASELLGMSSDAVLSVTYGRLLQTSLLNLADWLDDSPRRALTPRQREVLKHVQLGRTDREIAEALYLSTKTVGHHVSAILSTFGVATRQSLKGG